MKDKKIKTFDFYCSHKTWLLCERHDLTEVEAEAYAKLHDLRYEENEDIK